MEKSQTRWHCLQCGRHEADVLPMISQSAGLLFACMDHGMFQQCPVPATWLAQVYMEYRDKYWAEYLHRCIAKRWRELVSVPPAVLDLPTRPNAGCVCVVGGPDKGTTCRECGEYVPVTT